MTPDVISFIKELADKLGTTATHIIELYSHQALINSIVDVSAFVILTTFFVLAHIFLCKYYNQVKVELKENEKDHYYSARTSQDRMCLTIFCLGVTILLHIIVTACYISDANIIIAGFFNPEYVAINNILSQIK